MPMGIALGGGLGLGGGGRPVVYLLRDEFTTAEAAPISSPRDAEPGPGALLVTESTGNYTFISDGKLQFSGGGSDTGYNDPMVSGGALARAVGRTFLLQVSGLETGGYYIFAFAVAADSWGFSGGVKFATTGDIRLMDQAWPASGTLPRIADNGEYDDTTTHDLAFVLRTQGLFILARKNDGDWKLLFPAVSFDGATIYPALATYAGTLESEYMRVADLASPWDSDYGLATDRLAGARSQGDTFSHEADCIVEFTLDTLPSSGAIWFEFRQQTEIDDTWRVSIDALGNMNLVERAGGSPTTRASAAGVLSGGERIVIVCDGETIAGYYDNTRAWGYGFAANFKTETGGSIASLSAGSAVSDIITWPRTLSGAALSALEAI